MSVNPVELHVGYWWDCDTCGRENLVRPRVRSTDEMKRDGILTDEDIDKIRRDDEMKGVSRWTEEPKGVQCVHCGAKFEVDSGDEDEDNFERDSEGGG